MIALLSVMTSLALVALGLGLVVFTLKNAGSRIITALAGQMPSAEVIPLPVRHRSSVRVTVPAFRSPTLLRAAA